MSEPKFDKWREPHGSSAGKIGIKSDYVEDIDNLFRELGADDTDMLQSLSRLSAGDLLRLSLFLDKLSLERKLTRDERAGLSLQVGSPLLSRIASLEAELAERSAPVDRMRRWVSDLQTGMYVNCVYCGHRYGPGETTPVSMADALKAHIEQCPEHPMSHLKAALAEADEALRELRAAAERVSNNATKRTGQGVAYNVPGNSMDELRSVLSKRVKTGLPDAPGVSAGSAPSSDGAPRPRWEGRELYLGGLYCGCIMRMVPENWREWEHLKNPEPKLQYRADYYAEREATPWRGWFMKDEDGDETGWFATEPEAEQSVEHALAKALSPSGTIAEPALAAQPLDSQNNNAP